MSNNDFISETHRIGLNDQGNEALRERAEWIRNFYQALVNEGFTKKEAMELTLQTNEIFWRDALERLGKLS